MAWTEQQMADPDVRARVEQLDRVMKLVSSAKAIAARPLSDEEARGVLQVQLPDDP